MKKDYSKISGIGKVSLVFAIVFWFFTWKIGIDMSNCFEYQPYCAGSTIMMLFVLLMTSMMLGSMMFKIFADEFYLKKIKKEFTKSK